VTGTVLSLAAEVLGCEPEDLTAVRMESGHSGPGWYVWYTMYPDEGSLHLEMEPRQ
jgi:hypothetical protein